MQSSLLPIKALILAAGLLVTPAHAEDNSVELVDAWKVQASDLHTRLSALRGNDIPDLMRLEISRFGRIATRLAIAGEKRQDFPSDLKCIFRGMADEAESQLTEIANAVRDEDTESAKKRLLLMLEDAGVVAEAARIALDGSAPSAAPESDAPATCPVAPTTQSASFTDLE